MDSRRIAATALVLAAAILACRGPTPTSRVVPSGPLPDDARPLGYRLTLEIDPARQQFSGEAVIDVQLERPVQTLWLHGEGLEVSSAELSTDGGERVAARWESADDSGVASVTLPARLGPGKATLRIAYRAAFNERLRGLYRVEDGGASYAFTQFEPISARRAFPGFDEPRFKTPFDVTLVVPASAAAIANTPSIAVAPLHDGRQSIRFARTKPIPTYLVAWAVGPFDVSVPPPMRPLGPRARALALRGVASSDRGGELAYALQHTPALLEALEAYFGSEYPYAKLDLISVPDFGAGAMENVGAITFRDSLLLLDPEAAPEWQRRAFTYVMAHELAHQWFGNLVTMRWWDDVWLNEAFATWMGHRVVQEVAPEQRSELSLLESVHGAMGADSLVSARSIRQPIESQHDIFNAFDPITYSKGAGVLAMFERWLGRDVFQRGIRRYLERHRFASATQDDLVAALAEASGQDVATPFRSFLTQPGVPFLELETQCSDGRGTLSVQQSRYLPVGSGGESDALWEVPLCARYAIGDRVRESCDLVREATASVPTEGGCPDWVMPNADASGYYRWSLAGPDQRRLMETGWSHLTERERLSVAMNLEAGFHAGAVSPAAVFTALAPLANDRGRLVAEAPMQLVALAREQLVAAEERPRVQEFARALYEVRYRELGWNVRTGEDGETKLLRRSVIYFLAFTAKDAGVRREALRRGRVYLGLDAPTAGEGSLDAELIDSALAVAVQDGDAAIFEALLGRLPGERDAIERSRILRALGAAREPAQAERARSLSLDPSLRTNEVFTTLWAQVGQLETRAATWEWITRNFDALVERAGSSQARTIPWLASSQCSEKQALDLETFLGPEIDAYEGGPRSLAGAAEAIRLCAALRERQGPDTRAFFAKR